MKKETANFTFTLIDYKYTESKEKSMYSPNFIKTGISSAYVICKKCNNDWNSCGFEKIFSGFYVAYPECGVSEKIRSGLLMSN